MAIPRIIHQTWKSHELPPTLARFAARWQELNPTYAHQLWTDADNDAFVEREFPRYFALYRSFSRGIYRADLARCLYLWRFGGVYVDLDVEPLRPLDEFLAAHGDCVLGAEPVAHAQKRRGKPRMACNAFMASRPGHPFWQRMVEEIERRAAVGGEPVGVTGPIALDAVHERWGHQLGVAVSEPDAFFPLPDLDAQSLPIGERAREHYRRMRALGLYPQATFGVHHWAHTWIPEAPLNRAVQRLFDTSRRVHAVLRGERTADEVLRPERYELVFPERLFPPRRSRESLYRARVARGGEIAARSTLTVLTLLRDRLDLALMLRARCEALLAEFRGGQVLVLGEDSRDGTERVLAEWAAARPGVVHGAAAPELPSELRGFSRMARLRNALCEQAERLPPTDFVAVLDGDLEGPLSLEGVRHALSLLAEPRGPDGVAALGVNNWVGLPVQLPFVGYGYYDPIAFRERAWSRRTSDAAIRCRLAGARRGDEPIPVRSAFAGLALYRGASVRGLRYDEGAGDCEHVGFHRALYERGGRLVLDPSLMLLAGRQGHHRTERP